MCQESVLIYCSENVTECFIRFRFVDQYSILRVSIQWELHKHMSTYLLKMVTINIFTNLKVIGYMQEWTVRVFMPIVVSTHPPVPYI